MDEEITYTQAKEARDVLVKYLEKRIGYESVSDYKESRRHTEILALYALTQDYFLD